MGNRRSLIKTKSVSAAIIILLSCILLTFASNRDDGMIEIVMAKDTTSFVGGVVNQEIVEQMVWASIVELTGVIDDLPFAFECLFPYGAITDSTQIVIKYNPNSCTTTRQPMLEALKKGLTFMLDYTFPADNITLVGDAGEAGRADTITIDTTRIVFDTLGNPIDTIEGQNLKYVIKDVYTNADFIIYCPSAWGTDLDCGVDMCLNLMTTSIEGVGGANMNKFYNFVHDTISPSLSLLNYHPTFNGDYEKVVLYMMDLLSVSGTGDSADLQPGYKIYTTKNITVCDWKGIRYLKDTLALIDSLSEWQAHKVCSLSVVPIDLGVVNEGQMLELPIGPPWAVGVITDNNMVHSYNVQVKANRLHTVFSFAELAGTNAKITIFDIQGRKIWTQTTSEKKIVWNNSDLRGNRVPSGVYIYKITSGDAKVQGKTTIKR